MKSKAGTRRFFFFHASPWVVLFISFWMTGAMVATGGCSQSQSDKEAQSGGTTGPATSGSTGSGTLADEDEQKLPVNPKDYKPMPIPNPSVTPSLKEGEDPQDPAVQPVSPQESSEKGKK